MLVHYVHKDSLVCGGARQSYIEVYLPIVVGGWRGKHNSILLHTLFYPLRVQSIRICVRLGMFVTRLPAALLRVSIVRLTFMPTCDN